MDISEVEIKELVEAVQEKAPDYQLDWQTYLVGNLWGVGGFWLENPQYFIFIYLSKNYQAIAKKDIQGLQVENREKDYRLNIRLTNGQYYQVDLLKGVKDLPNHEEKLNHLVERLSQDFGDRQDMKNHSRYSGGLLAAQIILLVLTVVAAIVGALTKSLPILVLAIVCALAYRFHVIPRLVYRIHPPKDQ